MNAECKFRTDSMRASFYEMAGKYDNRSTMLLDLQEMRNISNEVKDEIETAANLAYNLTVAGNIVVEENGQRTVPENDAFPLRSALELFRKQYIRNEHDYIQRRKMSERRTESTYAIEKNMAKWNHLRSKLEECEQNNQPSVEKMMNDRDKARGWLVHIKVFIQR